MVVLVVILAQTLFPQGYQKISMGGNWLSLPLHFSPVPGMKRININAHLQSYDRLKVRIQSQQDSFHLGYASAESNSTKQILMEQAKKYLLEKLTKKVFPFWYGTPWDFNGTTETPLKGQIACGYFITTVMKHVGFEVERYKLAQQPASTIIKTLCLKKSIKSFGTNGIEKLIGHLRNNNDGLYIVGLDYHVGFIEKSKNGLFIIHSNYYEPQEVVKEKIEESKALSYSSTFLIGNLLDNEAIIKKWLKKEKIATLSY